MKLRLAKSALLSLIASSLLAVSMTANARAIRVDGEGDEWTAAATSAGPIEIGFTFNFFGITTTTLTINANGSVSFGGAVIAPFLDNSQTNIFNFSTSVVAPAPGIPSGIRIQWGDETTENQFQLAIFDLSNDVFAMEFNYGQITAGSDDSFIGYDNGAGTSFDLLDDLGGILGLSGPLLFDDYMGIGVDGNAGVSCEAPASVLACNNFNALTGDFGPGNALLPSDFAGFFQLDPSLEIAAQGRYFFLVDNGNGTAVPEPGTLWLLGIGSLGLFMSRRRQLAGIQMP